MVFFGDLPARITKERKKIPVYQLGLALSRLDERQLLLEFSEQAIIDGLHASASSSGVSSWSEKIEAIVQASVSVDEDPIDWSKLLNGGSSAWIVLKDIYTMLSHDGLGVKVNGDEIDHQSILFVFAAYEWLFRNEHHFLLENPVDLMDQDALRNSGYPYWITIGHGVYEYSTSSLAAINQFRDYFMNYRRESDYSHPNPFRSIYRAGYRGSLDGLITSYSRALRGELKSNSEKTSEDQTLGEETTGQKTSVPLIPPSCGSSFPRHRSGQTWNLPTEAIDYAVRLYICKNRKINSAVRAHLVPAAFSSWKEPEEIDRFGYNMPVNSRGVTNLDISLAKAREGKASKAEVFEIFLKLQDNKLYDSQGHRRDDDIELWAARMFCEDNITVFASDEDQRPLRDLNDSQCISAFYKSLHRQNSPCYLRL